MDAFYSIFFFLFSIVVSSKYYFGAFKAIFRSNLLRFEALLSVETALPTKITKKERNRFISFFNIYKSEKR